METLAYLHLVEDFQNSEAKALHRDLPAAIGNTAGKAAIGLTGLACTVGVLGTPNAAFACYYPSQQSDYYSYPSDSNQSCGCNQSQQSYSPDYSQDYSYGYSQDYSYGYSQDYYPGYSHDYYSYDSYYAPADYHAAGPNIVSPGTSGALIATLQGALADRGYYNGPIDGVYGPGTADAVAQYQIDSGLAVDGVAGSQTLYSLGLAG